MYASLAWSDPASPPPSKHPHPRHKRHLRGYFHLSTPIKKQNRTRCGFAFRPHTKARRHKDSPQLRAFVPPCEILREITHFRGPLQRKSKTPPWWGFAFQPLNHVSLTRFYRRFASRFRASSPLCARQQPQLPRLGFFGSQCQQAEQSRHALHGSAPVHRAARAGAMASSRHRTARIMAR